METTKRAWTLGQLAQLLNGTLDGPADRLIVRPVPAGISDPAGITFAESPEYLSRAIRADVGAVLVARGTTSPGVATIQTDHPRAAFGRVLAMFQRPLPLAPGIHPTAVISPDAIISPTAMVGPYAVVERHATIGDGTKIYSFAYVGEGCSIGKNVTINPHAVLYQDVTVGDRSIIHAGAIVGADGFGFVWNGPDRAFRVKVPQVGTVEIGSDVEIGALTAVDRATAGSTVLGQGVKLDNLVQIGHNCKIGEHTVIAGQTAMGGSSEAGRRNDIGGHVAITDHVKVGDNVILAGRTGVTNDIDEPGPYWGTPARPMGMAKRIIAVMQRLPEMHRTIRDLENRLAKLEQKASDSEQPCK
ncbi:MAG: UDP-3-O-(3-hydroxymyristoyl)glucosamine N-acyltransferase [Fimbriimonas sp.]|nr:UDP-3-O-(3-hydroxymyristoyl)glucosamine N-acyltransferase [Fimbriimonas sp.]